jgi:hypothetical protein
VLGRKGKKERGSVGASALCGYCASCDVVLGVRRVCEFPSGFEFGGCGFGVGILRCSPGMLWSSLVQWVFSMCVVVLVSRLGLANFAVVGGWFESGFRHARWTNPPPSPNGEV